MSGDAEATRERHVPRRVAGATGGNRRHVDPVSALDFVVRPFVPVLLPWIWVWAHWMIFRTVTARFPATGAPLRLISGGELALISGVNAIFAVVLVRDVLSIRTYASCIRRPLVAGVAFAIVDLVFLQIGSVIAFDPFLLR